MSGTWAHDSKRSVVPLRTMPQESASWKPGGGQQPDPVRSLFSFLRLAADSGQLC